jgi:mannose-6-phosphate isomerase-like protein (cupin superfamily)
MDAPMAPQALGTMRIAQLWSGPLDAPADNRAPLETASGPFRFAQLAEPTYAMMLAEYAPGQGRDDPGLHATDTADHFYVISGEVVLVLETGDVTLRAGDVGVVRGVVHGWRNDGDVPARLVTFVLPATPSVAP